MFLQVVLDIGAGSGILSFFAIQAGARHVYAVDASDITTHCQQLVNSNGLTNQITVIKGKIEEVCIWYICCITTHPQGCHYKLAV